ncbi:crotonase/enoyl-CoA hydratase family protein [Deefgea piscis]|uniref:crotonase/enoyl-CoA hydratase family protein n=1 Tax=Deefgea piscis TaxID=2739061 RepID=UPI001C7E2B6B|nr:crotonase/enoyl-CoA hydratase family protein [Deefgea piscis]QZA80064.1 crotonase/enoyl-CoA hydratase family protein [Deefgea piscis]
MPNLLLEIKGPIAYVSLNRPEKRNAMSFSLLMDLVETAKQLKKNKQIRCVILMGQGESFSAGIDLNDLNQSKNRLFAFWQLIKPGQSIFQKAFLIWQTLPFPVIAVLHGHCFGAGMQLALAADFRISAPDCQLSIMESRWGLVPDMGITQTLRGLIASDVAKELTFTGRIVSGTEAKALGLISAVNETPLIAATEMAERLCRQSPDALHAGKQVLNAMHLKPNKALRLEKIWQLKLLLGKNSRLARKASKDITVQFAPRQYD